MPRLKSKSSASELEVFEPFAALSRPAREVLAQGTVVSDCPVGSIILHKGQPVSGAYLVLRGRLRVFTISPGGTEATLYFVRAGEACVLALNCLFGELFSAGQVSDGTALFERLVGDQKRDQGLASSGRQLDSDVGICMADLLKRRQRPRLGRAEFVEAR